MEQCFPSDCLTLPLLPLQKMITRQGIVMPIVMHFIITKGLSEKANDVEGLKRGDGGRGRDYCRRHTH